MVHKHCVVTKRYYITRQDSQKMEGPKTEARGDSMAQMSPETMFQ